jgi:cell wall-associated NlpC family hydrolase
MSAIGTGAPETWAYSYVAPAIPFKEKGRTREEGCDCWGIIRLGYLEQAGIALPAFLEGYPDTKDTELLAALIHRERQDLPFRPVAERMPGESLADFHRRLAPLIRPLDVLLLPIMGDLCHVGLACGGGQFIHTEVGVDCRINAYAGQRAERWAIRLAEGGAWRHRDVEGRP